MFNYSFAPFLSGDNSLYAGDHVFRNSLHQTFMTSHEFGNQTLLQDEIGRNIGSIQHLTDNWDILRDATGHELGSIRHDGVFSVHTDATGMVEHTANHFGDHTQVFDSHHQLTADVNHVGSHVDATDHLGTNIWSASDV